MEIMECCAGLRIKRMDEADAEAILALYRSNPQYFAAMNSDAEIEGVRSDLVALPDGKGPEDKHYLGLYDGDRLAAVIDLIERYPDAQTIFIGLFMVDAAWQGQGLGSRIVRECLNGFAREGYARVRLGYVEGNAQSEAFWKKNGFAPTGVRSEREGYTVILAQREL